MRLLASSLGPCSVPHDSHSAPHDIHAVPSYTQFLAALYRSQPLWHERGTSPTGSLGPSPTSSSRTGAMEHASWSAASSIVPAGPQRVQGPVDASSPAFGALTETDFSSTSTGRSSGSSLMNVSPAVPSQLKFTCAMCQLQCPLAQGVQKGIALWCDKDNRAYNSLRTRWTTNKKLKQWWTSLTAVQKQGWFRKWQHMDAKRRFELISFVEETVAAQEQVEDEIDKYITYDMWRREELDAGYECTEASLAAKWKEIVESMRFECIFRRGQWLIPHFAGVERRNRKRLTLAQTAARAANVSDPEQMLSLWQGGAAALNSFAQSAMVPKSAPQICGPAIDARPEDMPQPAQPQNVILDAIVREAI